MNRFVVNPTTVFDSLRYGFSQAVVVDGRRVLLSGQVGVDADERTLGPGMAVQAHAALDNVASILKEVGGTLRDVVFLRIYIVQAAADAQDEVAAVLRDRFAEHPPASSWIIVNGLSVPEWLIEVEAEAVLPDR